MRLYTVALSMVALGVATAAASTERVGRDITRKMEVRDPRKHHNSGRSEQLYTDCKLTWYGGGQLSAPACGGATPTRDSSVVAVKEGGDFKCGDTVHIHHNNKMVAAKVVDYCAGCTAHHIDATQGVFEKLADLSVGEMSNLHVRVIPKN